MSKLESLLKLVGGARDNALLRLAIASELLAQGEAATAASHCRQALAWQPDYTAAWKLLGKALTVAGGTADALQAYRQGIVVANAHGDIQAAREMTVFARRLEKLA